MTELYALTSRHLRAALRSRASRAAGILCLLGIGLAVWIGVGDEHADGLVILAALLVIALLCGAFAVGAGAVLPEDRVTGRDEWLAALAPPGWKRRLSVVLAGWILAVGCGALGGLAAGIALSVARPGLALTSHESFAVPPETIIGRSGSPATLALPDRAMGADRIELDVRPLFRAFDRPIDRVDVAWVSGPMRGSLRASVRGPLRLAIPSHAASLELTTRTRGVRLRVIRARILGESQAPVTACLVFGLFLGALAGAVAPVAVLVSRKTTGQTAAACAFCLLLFGAGKPGLLALAGAVDMQGWMAVAPAILRTAGWLAPDAPILELLVDAEARLAPGPSAMAWLVPVLAYTLVATVLASLPVPARFARGANA